RPYRREQAADADPKERGQEDEVREVRQQPDVGRHPPDQNDFDEQNEERREEDPKRAHQLTGVRSSSMPHPGSPSTPGPSCCPCIEDPRRPSCSTRIPTRSDRESC